MDETKNYRKNIMAIILNKQWEILIWKYLRGNASRTIPKWGLELNESPETALFREIFEETWIPSNKLLIVHKYDKYYKKEFTKEQIDWKIKNKWENYIWKIEIPYILLFSWTNNDINIWINWEFSDYQWIQLNNLKDYINPDLIEFLDINFINQIFSNYENY